MVCLAASTGLATVASSIATSDQTFQITGSPVTVASQVLTTKLPLPAKSKIVTLNMPTTQGGMEHVCHPFLLVLVFTPARMDAKVSCGWQNLTVISTFVDCLFFYEKEALLVF